MSTPEESSASPSRRSRRVVFVALPFIAATGAWYLLRSSDDDIRVDAAVAAAQPAMEELIAAGRQPYIDHCATCHRTDGKGFPDDIPALDGSKVVRGPKSKHVAIVLNGRPGTAMPAFKAQLTDYQIAAILTYERNAWTYRTLDSVTPAQVQVIREQAASAPAK